MSRREDATARAVEPGAATPQRLASDLLFPTVAAVALAHLALVALLPEPTVPQLAGFELAVLVGILAVDQIARRERRGSHLTLAASVFAALVGGAWLLVTHLGALPAVLLLGATVLLWGYGLHRYQLVALGLVGDVDEQ